MNYIDVYSRALVAPSSSTPSLPTSSADIVGSTGAGLPGSSGSPATDGSVPAPIATSPAPSGFGNSSASVPAGSQVPQPSGPPGSDGAPGPTSPNSPVPVPSGPAGSGAPSGPFSGNTPIQSLPSASSGLPGSISPTSPVSSSPSPVDSLVPARDPATIGNFALLGCFASTTRFSTFNLSGDNGQMTPEVCAGLCSGRIFAGTHERTCYCADALDAGTAALPDRSRCNIPCPGNPEQFCGGNNLLARRDAPNSFLLTMYINLVGRPAANPPPAPGMGGSGPGDGVASVTRTITSTVTYTTVCSTNPALLVTQEYCTTLKVPSCARCAAGQVTKPTVPMTAITQACNKCGANGESTVTLTVPVGVASGSANGGNIGGQQPGSKPGDVGPPPPGGSPGQQAVPKPPTPGAPPAAPVAPGAPVAPVAPGGGPAPGPNANGPAPQPAAKVGNATVPAPTQQVGSTATVGLKPVQAGAERTSRMNVGVVFGMVLVGLLF